MSSQYSKRHSEEFKRDAIALARSSSKTVTEVARDLGVSPESLRGWVKRARIDRGEDGAAALTSAKTRELKQCWSTGVGHGPYVLLPGAALAVSLSRRCLSRRRSAVSVTSGTAAGLQSPAGQGDSVRFRCVSRPQLVSSDWRGRFVGGAAEEALRGGHRHRGRR
ncbi:transposase [Streptomyces sp. NPDC051776]|uniref:transposase n=1 Tax=Streptomyces sp. NPDC051776 TaxID=3155414 RepID=UPI00343121ED